MRVPLFVPFSLSILLMGCGERSQSLPPGVEAPYVKIAVVTPAEASEFGLSGTVRARVEVPLAFQVGGRIIARRVDSGQAVHAGQVLLELDGADLEQSLRAAEADLAAAGIALATAQADLTRDRQLRERALISVQALERGELAHREARTRREAAAAHLAQARNARGYARLRSPAAGILIDVSGESGQVVPVGQTVAVLAESGAREIEVFAPAETVPPPRGTLLLPDGATTPLELRETSGAVETQGRTRRARYTVLDGSRDLVLGAVVATRFPRAVGPTDSFIVPVAALDERGAGARVWRVADRRVEPVAVDVLGMDDSFAHVQGPLLPGDTIVALGTHLLNAGMAVRTLPR